jgi:hypothetical protein
MPSTLELVSPLAGKPAPSELLVDVPALLDAYYSRRPDLSDPTQVVAFGTSGHRGSSLRGSFNEAHILAITQAICDYRRTHETDGPVFVGKDTHALSGPAQRTALEVLAANRVQALIAKNDGVTPTPVISHAILTYNDGRREDFADGIVVTPSHNPPDDGGFKYNPKHGGPAETAATSWIESRANALLRAANAEVKRVSIKESKVVDCIIATDFITPYVRDLSCVVDVDAIRGANLRLAVDPLGGASGADWAALAEFVWIARARMRWQGWWRFGIGTTSPLLMTPTPIATESSHARPACLNPITILQQPFVTCLQIANGGRRQRASAKRLSPARPSIEWSHHTDADYTKCLSASKGSSSSSLPVRRALEERKALVPAFCGRTAAPGLPTKMGSSWTCFPPNLRRAPGEIRASITRRFQHN